MNESESFSYVANAGLHKLEKCACFMAKVSI